MSQPDLRAALRHQDTISTALASRSHEELVALAADLMRTYVIDGTGTQKPDVGRVHVPQSLRGLPFDALIETLKFHLDLRELEQFSVSDGKVFVKLGDREFSLDGAPPPRPSQPAAVGADSAGPRAARPSGGAFGGGSGESRPAPAGPFGGGSSDSRPAPRAGGNPVEQPPTVREAPPRPEAPREADDRFRMLELD